MRLEGVGSSRGPTCRFFIPLLRTLDAGAFRTRAGAEAWRWVVTCSNVLRQLSGLQGGGRAMSVLSMQRAGNIWHTPGKGTLQ